MNFHSIYSHEFARVAACTIVSRLADPAAILDAARACHAKSVAVAVFPELCLSGYAVEDLLLQDFCPPAGTYDGCTTVDVRPRARKSIPRVPPPRKDPVCGSGGPFSKLWKQAQ